jgi:hypothetical protein
VICAPPPQHPILAATPIILYCVGLLVSDRTPQHRFYDSDEVALSSTFSVAVFQRIDLQSLPPQTPSTFVSPSSEQKCSSTEDIYNALKYVTLCSLPSFMQPSKAVHNILQLQDANVEYYELLCSLPSFMQPSKAVHNILQLQDANVEYYELLCSLPSFMQRSKAVHNILHLHPVAHCYYNLTFFFRLCAACQCLKHFIVFSTLVTF